MKTVLAPGVWDCFHIGHLQHLHAARKLGDELVVSVTPAKFVNKGPGRPIFSDEERLEMIRALRIVDHVYLEKERCGVDIINEVMPDIYVCGLEYLGAMPFEVSDILASFECECRYLSTRTTYSTTKIITGELLRERIGNFVESL